jgi:hypothetical protein
VRQLAVRLGAGAVLRVGAKQPQRDRRGDEARDDRTQQEERRKLEAERPHHG